MLGLTHDLIKVSGGVGLSRTLSNTELDVQSSIWCSSYILNLNTISKTTNETYLMNTQSSKNWRSKSCRFQCLPVQICLPCIELRKGALMEMNSAINMDLQKHKLKYVYTCREASYNFPPPSLSVIWHLLHEYAYRTHSLSVSDRKTLTNFF